MFIIFGWGKVTSKTHGWTEAEYCEYCRNTPRHVLVEKRTWFTLFFIPIIPYEHKHLCLCPICHSGYEYPKEVFHQLVLKSNDPALESTQSQLPTSTIPASMSTVGQLEGGHLQGQPMNSKQVAVLTSDEQSTWRCKCGNVNPSPSDFCLKCRRSFQAII